MMRYEPPCDAFDVAFPPTGGTLAVPQLDCVISSYDPPRQSPHCRGGSDVEGVAGGFL